MKAKLLRKVRKRYSIIKIDTGRGNVSYEIKDKYDLIGFSIVRFYSFSSIDHAKDLLIVHIRREYKWILDSRIKQTKVWYNTTKL